MICCRQIFVRKIFTTEFKRGPEYFFKGLKHVIYKYALIWY